jgi:hypothetical protein
MTPYQICICNNEDGTFKGAYVIETPDSQPRPLNPEDWPRNIDGINFGALAKVVELEIDLAAKNALIDSAKNAIKFAIADANLDDAATVSAIKQVLAAAELPSVEKRKLEIAAEIAAKQAELESL